MCSKAINNEKGVALILIAVSIVILFGFGALAIDVGHLYNVKNQLQEAADAAALAGADGMSGGTLPLMTQSAFDAADKIAQHNYADVSANTGRALPVRLLPGDVVLGIWAGNTFTSSTDPTKINAVQVFANRAGANADQPRANNWFAKVFSILPLGPTFNLSSVTATAIAAKESGLRVLPIVVNEYWFEPNNKAPYANQAYPQSFVRKINVDLSTSQVWRNTFAILGQCANPNDGSNDLNGYVDLNERWDNYKGTGSAHYQNGTDANAVQSCSNCSAYFQSNDPGNNGKFDTTVGGGLYNLNNGYPPGWLLPTAVIEPVNTTSGYPSMQAAKYPVTVGCPYATLSYFPTSGNDPLNKIDPANYQQGDQFVAMVYDGTHGGAGQGQVTIVGYVVIMIDGYDTGNNPPAFKTYAQDPSYAYNQNVKLKNKMVGTMYGHAVGDIIAPTVATPWTCDSIKTQLGSSSSGGGKSHLVGPSLKYGLITH